MAEKRHRTVLEIKVDDRQIKGLGDTLHRSFDSSLFEAFEAVLERSTKHLDTMARAAERMESAARRGASSGGGGAGGMRGGGGGGNDLSQAVAALSRSIQQLEANSRRGGGGGASAATMAAATYSGSYLGNLAARVGGGGEGFVAQAVGGIPIFGGFLAGAVNSIQRYYQEFAQQQIQIAQNVGTLGSRQLAGGRNFTRFGLSRGAAFGQASQFAQSAGMAGGLDEAGNLNALELMNLGGIADPAAILGAQGVAGGMAGRDPVRVMMQAVSAGVMSGVREARLPQFVAAAAQVLEQGRLEGVELSDDTVMQIAQGFASIGQGFYGERAQRAMSSAIPTMRAFAPSMDMQSLIGLRAAGFGTAGGPSFHEAMRMFQENPEMVLPQIIEQLRGAGQGNEGATVELMRQILPRFLGFTPSIQQARDLVAGDLSGFGAGVGTQGAEQFLARRRDSLMGAFGVPAAEADQADFRAGIGGSVSGAAMSLRSIENALTQSVLPRVATGIEAILTWLQEVYAQFEAGGFGQAMLYAFGSMIGALGEQIYSGIADNVGGRVGDRLRESGAAARELLDDPGRVLGNLPGDIGHLMTRHLPRDLPRAEADPDRPLRGWRFERDAEGNPVREVPVYADEPTSSAADVLRRMSRDAAQAAELLDRAGLPSEGQLAMG